MYEYIRKMDLLWDEKNEVFEIVLMVTPSREGKSKVVADVFIPRELIEEYFAVDYNIFKPIEEPEKPNQVGFGMFQ